MVNTVFTRTYCAPDFDKKEILRYAGVCGEPCELEEILEGCVEEIKTKLVYKVCYREFPLTRFDGRLDLGFIKTASVGLTKNLAGCESIVLFAATVGMEIDRQIARYATLSPTKALLFQAIGAERIEGLCDAFCRDIAEEKAKIGFKTRPRFSAGYGDFPLEAQKEIFAVLDCPRKIGLTLNQCLLMSPSKSVTAIIGVGK
ncbi:MAG: Vitamin B12 dependent methionine synthase activation subunit [Clostridia bacterium]|nr:Vitamin B12 dependent methionine synthase activation subunit [Clostridia bacterium]